ncbi:recombinase family protein [Roseibium polysiphoniae]|uniref:recombinase family protein n=1 Tax=Roseibium polysiphoniae TaxID=2571221 RepID=UPI0032969346
MLTMFAAMAQFEREIVLERQREGIAKAKAEGKYKGRKPTVRNRIDDILRLKTEGLGVTADRFPRLLSSSTRPLAKDLD